MNDSARSEDGGSVRCHLQVDPGLSLPATAAVGDWVAAALDELAARGQDVSGQISIRMLDRDSSAKLNRDYRGKARPTNVLSFPAVTVPGLPEEAAQP
ncbi:MAG TPA: rRNA maturation RNase YbeY, partial [Chromatiales bacterium]|nr:rRNA maturation RNase YbeY [Chromatiales bacterium]